MRRSMLALGALILLVGTPALATPPADPVGHWLVTDGAFALQIQPCGDAFCGRIAWAPADPATGEIVLDRNNPVRSLRQRSLLGLDVLDGLTPAAKAGEWRQGSFYDPRDGKTYQRASLRFDGDGSVVLSGYADVKHRGRTVRSRFSHTVRLRPTSPEALASR